MIVNNFLHRATGKLEKAGIASARLDVLILLEDVLARNRASILAHPELNLSSRQITMLNNYITQRTLHTPLAYIRGTSMFYGRSFTITTDVLVPRPESEAMITLLLRISKRAPNALHIADIGTGSGCLGITAKLELPTAQVGLYDISPAALACATHNAKLYGVEVMIEKVDLIKEVSTPGSRYNVVLANLPYVPDDFPINQAAAHEPKIALFAGSDGLDLYRRIFMQVATLTDRPRHIITESLQPQHSKLKNIAKKAGYYLQETEGLAQHFLDTLDRIGPN